MLQQFEEFHSIQQPNGEYFTVPVRFVDLFPFKVDRPCVVYAFDRVAQRRVVIKKIILPYSYEDRQPWKHAQRELYCMLEIENENIVKLYSVFTPAQAVEEMTEFYIVREFLGGSMQSLAPSTFATEKHRAVKSILFDLCSAVHHLHHLNISYRDLKPANVLIADNVVKLCDFGHSCMDDPYSNTPYIVQRFYRAPEIVVEISLSFRRQTSVDIWSLGCLFAELLTGRILFHAQDQISQFLMFVRFLGNPDPLFYSLMHGAARNVFQNIATTIDPPPADLYARFPDHLFREGLSSDAEQCSLARDLLFKMLVIDPEQRIDIQMVLSHPYLREICDCSIGSGVIPFPPVPELLTRSLQFQYLSSCEEMKSDIFERVKKFGKEFNIFTESKN